MRLTEEIIIGQLNAKVQRPSSQGHTWGEEGDIRETQVKRINGPTKDAKM